MWFPVWGYMLEIVDQYKYLGIIVDEFDMCVQALSSAGDEHLGTSL